MTSHIPIRFSKNFSKLLCIVFLLGQSYTGSVMALGWDARNLKSINSHYNHGFGQWVNAYENSLFVVGAGLPAGFWLYGKMSHRDNWRDKGIEMAVNEALVISSVLLLKKAVNRQRPYERFDWVRHDKTESDSSFPSGHAAGSAAVATFLIMRVHKPLLTVGAVVWSAGVSLGRVYQGVHYPSDVLAGMLLGTSISYFNLRFGPLRPKNRLKKPSRATLFLGMGSTPDGTPVMRGTIRF